MTDVVTGRGVGGELTVAAPPARVRDAVSDVGGMARWSPECVGADWRPGWSAPVVGARFEGRNLFADGYRSTVVCVLTQVDGPSMFAWDVLGDDLDPTTPRPGSPNDWPNYGRT